MEERLISVISSTLNITSDELREHFDSKDIWESLSRVEVVFAVEDEFGIQFDEDELARAVTPALFCEITMRKVSA